jgi:small-conductance mechanosensitive channel
LYLSTFNSLNLDPLNSLHILQHELFKIGPLPITPIFLIKACLFLFLLVTVSRLLQRVLLARIFQRLSIADAQKFALGRFTTYLFFLGGLFIGLQSLGVNLSSLVVFGGAIGVGIGLGLQNVVSNFVAASFSSSSRSVLATASKPAMLSATWLRSRLAPPGLEQTTT